MLANATYLPSRIAQLFGNARKIRSPEIYSYHDDALQLAQFTHAYTQSQRIDNPVDLFF